MSIASTNPYTLVVERTFEPESPAQIEAKIAKADRCYVALVPNLERSRICRQESLLKLAKILMDKKEELGRLITLEMGKTLLSSQQEIEKCAKNCEYYAREGIKALETTPINLAPDSLNEAKTMHAPLGIVLQIMPWNFPFWQVIRCAAPILLAGNSVLLKHASNVPQCSLMLESLMKEAGFEDGAFQSLLISSKAIAPLIADPRIKGVTLTGSEEAGKLVASLAGQNLKKSVLELGGSDPFIVFPSANLEKAVSSAVTARLISNGQSCIAAKRFLIHESVYSEFRDRFVASMKEKRLGDPLLGTTDLGPLVSIEARDGIHALVLKAKSDGATLLCGGEIPDLNGAFYPATVLEKIPANAAIRTEEVFGPVAALYSFASLDEAIVIANSTPFGLGASVWTEDQHERESCSLLIQAGSVFFNAIVASDPALPFGGIKNSGYGRELGTIGLYEFTNLKTVVTAKKLG